MATVEVYQRSDGRYAWHLIANNGNVIATDGGQGYENKSDAQDVARNVVNGTYSNATMNF